MKIAKFGFSLFGINSYVVYDSEAKECAVIDPGMINREEEEALSRFLERENLKVKYIINTHLHIDHAVGDSYVKNNYNAPILANKEDEFLGKRLQIQAEQFGIMEKVEDVAIDEYIEDGMHLYIGNGTLKVLSVPGHSPGSIALYDQDGGYVISGDALFAGSIGRTDLPGGDFQQLIDALSNKIVTLPANTVVYPGHGPATDINTEVATNPFLR